MAASEIMLDFGVSDETPQIGKMPAHPCRDSSRGVGFCIDQCRSAVFPVLTRFNKGKKLLPPSFVFSRRMLQECCDDDRTQVSDRDKQRKEEICSGP
jgi:hypothetical protein